MATFESQVKWIWPTATQYTVLCLPAFSPELSGREAEEGATVAKEGRPELAPKFGWAKIDQKKKLGKKP